MKATASFDGDGYFDVKEAGMVGYHRPVLLEEAVTGLITKSDGIYIDATFGRGGHSREILRNIGSDGTLICVDRDQEAIAVARQIDDRRLVVKRGSFGRLKNLIADLEVSGRVSGILLDLGVSSPQLDDAARGFSFLRDGPLDMRMDQSQKLTAAIWLKDAKEDEMSRVFRECGEERFSKRIAREIAKERAVAPIRTTSRLAEVVARAHPRWEEHKHPATRVFQAIRIFVNSELEDLASCLEQCLDILAIGGRLVVISFHSLEDRIVKNFMRSHSSYDTPKWLPLESDQSYGRLKRVGKAVHVSDEEQRSNPRSRSAILRIMEKIK